jgi:predicted MFS family arabinose efflux permease
MAAGIFNSSISFGQMLGPIMGATLFKFFGFRTTCDIISVTSLTLALLFIYETVRMIKRKSPRRIFEIN